MRMLFVFCPSTAVDHVRDLVDVHEVYGLALAPDTRDTRVAGARWSDGTAAGPSTVVMTAAPEGKAQELIEALTSFAETCATDERIRVYQVPVERVI